MSDGISQLDIAFDEAELELGRELFEAGGVDVTEDGSDGLWEAQVKHFDRRCWVWVKRTSDGFEHDCDCPHFEETGKGCEHLQALLLALAPESDDEVDDAHVLRPRYRILSGVSEREGAVCVRLLDEDGAPLPLTHDAWAAIDDEEDVDAIRALASAAGGWQDVRRGGGFVKPFGPWLLAPENSARILDAVVATGRASTSAEERSNATPLAAEPGAPFELRLVERRDGAECVLYAELVTDAGGATPLEDAAMAIAAQSSWGIVGDALAPIVHRGAFAWLRTLRRGSSIKLAEGQLLPFLSRLEDRQPLPRLVTIDGPLDLVTCEPRGGASAFRAGGRWHVDLEAVYDGHVVGWSRPGDLTLDTDRRRQIERDRDAEEDLLQRLLALDVEADTEIDGRVSCDDDQAPALFDRLLEDGWALRIDGRSARPAGGAPFAITSSGHDWFEIEGGLAVDGDVVPLASALAAVASGRDWVAIDDENVALIPAAQRAHLARLIPLLGVAAEEEGALKLRAGSALLAEELLADADSDESFNELRDRLTSFDAQEAVAAPDALQAELRPYQRDGLSWLAFLDRMGLGGCLADEMGLGKTIQVIAEMLRRNDRGARGPHLVVAPRSLVGNWRDELGRFAPDLEVHIHTGGGVDVPDGTVVLTTYGLLRNHIDALVETDFDLAALDEAQAIKNRASRTAEAARRIRSAGRVALSGTPVENRLEELWSLMEFLNPGLLGAPTRFASLTRLDEASSRAMLRRALRPVLLRRTKEQVAPDLPRLIQQTVPCDLTPKQREVYDRTLAAARKATSTAAGPGSSAAILEALLRLRQAACHAALVDPEAIGESGKLELLLERLEEARESGRKALVFSQFTSLLDLVEPGLEERGLGYVRLDGSTTDRDTPVKRFQSDADCGVFLISLRAGGTGLNLTAADLVFILDPWWNPAVEAQAIGRAHRIGREGVVIAQRFVGRDTLEEKILAMQESKRELADAIIAADEGTKLTQEDLLALL